MIGVLPVEIRDFSSLNELSEFLDKEIAWYENLLKDYSEKLGSLLREQGFSSEEIEKILQQRGFKRQAAGNKGKKGKKGKKEKGPPSEGWFSFRGLLFSADKQGKAEIFFESVDKIEETINKMKETRTLIEELQKTGLGPGLAYSVYLLNGVPEKIFVQKAENAARKYKLELFLSTSMESAAALPADVEGEQISESENEKNLSEASGSNEDLEKDQGEKGEETAEEGSGSENPSGE